MLTRGDRPRDPHVVKPFVTLVAALVALLWTVSPAWAQGRVVRLDGYVQWIAGERMMLVLDSGPSVAVELGQVPQDQYRALAQRERVSVEGTLSPDNRRVFARSIIRDPYGTQSP